MFANLHHLVGDDIPLLQLGNQSRFHDRELPAARQLVFADKVLVVNGILGNRNRDLSRLGEDGKLACQNRVGRIHTCQQMTLRNPE